jgi:hypothetical protein
LSAFHGRFFSRSPLISHINPSLWSHVSLTPLPVPIALLLPSHAPQGTLSHMSRPRPLNVLLSLNFHLAFNTLHPSSDLSLPTPSGHPTHRSPNTHFVSTYACSYQILNPSSTRPTNPASHWLHSFEDREWGAGQATQGKFEVRILFVDRDSGGNHGRLGYQDLMGGGRMSLGSQREPLQGWENLKGPEAHASLPMCSTLRAIKASLSPTLWVLALPPHSLHFTSPVFTKPQVGPRPQLYLPPPHRSHVTCKLSK